MKVTLIRENRDTGTETVSTCEAESFIERIKTETKGLYITGPRNMLEYSGADYQGHYAHIDKLPHVFPSVQYGRSRIAERIWKRYNGVVMLEVNHLSGLDEVKLIKEQASLLPQTWLAFAGSSGRSVKIWVKFRLPDGGLPQKEEEAALFHAHAYRMAVQCYQPILAFPITLKQPSPADSCRMTLDKSPYVNLHAVAFCQEQPLAMPGEQTFRQKKRNEKNPLMRLQPGYETSQTFTLLFESVLNKVLNELDGWRRDYDDFQPFLIRLGECCHEAGIPEEEAVRQTMMHYHRQADEQTVRITLHNIYQEGKGYGRASALTPEQKIS